MTSKVAYYHQIKFTGKFKYRAKTALITEPYDFVSAPQKSEDNL